MQFKKLIYFVVLLIALTWVMDKIAFIGLNYLGKQVLTGAGYGKFQQFKSLKDSLDVVILGNSRANHHVDPTLFKGRAYNLGTHMRKIAYSATAVLMLPKEKKQIVLIQVDPLNSVTTDYQSEDLDMLIPHYFNNEIIKKQLDEYFTLNPIMNFYWCVSLNGNVLAILKNYFIPSYDPTHFQGFEGIEKPKGGHFSDIRLLKNDCQQSPQIQPLYMAHLKDIMEFGKLNNKQIVFFTSPSLKDSCNTDNKVLARTFAEMNATYFDFTTIDSYDTNVDYWIDAVHLSNAGAMAFSDTLSAVVYRGL